MRHTSQLPAVTTLLLALFLTTFGCKSNISPDPVVLTSLQGNWKITDITIDPAFVYRGVGITNLTSALPLLGETCLTDAVVTFNANGTIANNLATQASCTNAPFTKQIVNAFFGPTTTYSETANQATLTTGGQTVTGSKVFTATTATFVAKLPTDPSGAAVATTYTVVLTKR